ncbi:LytTR family transcriptional regulator DNA-binding domain-containing protein [Xanthomarina gelatinilytica]|uniref:LytTR family transcriptional regulator DNA-binding domain-containing protein n=1 Tax=Xanthomarina gelatinilytica TaxID=1137281 RepID=UPI003AA9CAEA
MFQAINNKLILGIIFIFSLSVFSQPDNFNDPEIIRLNSLLQKHARNADSLHFYANELLHYSKERNLDYWSYTAYMALGNSQRLAGKIIESNHSYHAALNIAKQLPDKQVQYRVVNNIALNYKRLHRNDSAVYYFKKLEAYYDTQQEVLPSSMAKMNLGLLFLKFHELDSAAYYLHDSYKGFKELEEPRYVAQSLNLLAELQLEKEKYKKALSYADSSMALSKTHDLKFMFPTNYSLLSRVYNALGQTEKSITYSELARELKPENTDFNKSRIAVLNDGINIQKAKAYQATLNDIEDSNFIYKSNLLIAIGVICVLILFIYFFLKRYKAIKKEVIDIQQNIDEIKAKKKLNEIESNKVIQLKSKATINSLSILYVKSDGHYVEYYLESKNKPEIDRSSMIEVEKMLPSPSFVRIHRSYIVNINRIKIINSNKVMLDTGEWINLSRVYKERLKSILHKA